MSYDILGDDILGDDMMGDDILGDDILGDDILGAQRKRKQAAQRSAVRSQSPLLSSTPGVEMGPAKGKIPLGFPTHNFAAAAAASANVATRPQKPVRIKRLVCSITGVNANLYAVTLSDLRVGTVSILASADGVDARTFGPESQGVELSAQSAQPGIDITASYSVAPPIAVGDNVRVQTTIICDSLV